MLPTSLSSTRRTSTLSLLTHPSTPPRDEELLAASVSSKPNTPTDSDDTPALASASTLPPSVPIACSLAACCEVATVRTGANDLDHRAC